MLKLPPRRGQALLEFALIALVLYLLLAGTLTFGLLFWSGSVIQQAVSTESTRSTHYTCSSSIAVAIQRATCRSGSGVGGGTLPSLFVLTS